MEFSGYNIFIEKKGVLMGKKQKEPLAAILLSVILPGAGQAYAGEVKRGVVFFLAFVFLELCAAFYLLSPSVRLNAFSCVIILGLAAFWVFILKDSYLAAKKHNEAHGMKAGLTPKKKLMFSGGLLLVIAVYLLFTRFIVSNYLRFYNAPPDSMEPTIYKGEVLLVNLLSYKRSQPQRGDIVLYRYPKDPSRIYMNRIIGFPGESVLLKDHRIFINGEQLKDNWAVKVRHYNAGRLARRNMPPVAVPQDSYYVLGDNAARSQDSRFWGCVTKSSLIGKVFKRFYPFKRSGPID